MYPGTLTTEPIQVYFENNDIVLNERFIQKISSQLKKFKQKDHSIYNVEKIFYRVHRKFLKNYTSHAGMDDLINKGDYDCVSGTILFSQILSSLGYDATIKFTPYHVYLIVNFDGSRVLIESTDPMTGIVKEEGKIRQKERLYAEEAGTKAKSTTVSKAMGLLFYNEAVYYYNLKDYKRSFDYAVKAFKIIDDDLVKDILKYNITHIIAEDLYTKSIQEQLLKEFLELLGDTESVTYN